MGKGVSGGVEDVFSADQMPTNNKPGKPNTLYRLKVPGGKGPEGQKQDRLTDAEGKPAQDTDYNHSDDGTHEFPHHHDWEDGVRGEDYVLDEFGGKDFYRGGQ